MSYNSIHKLLILLAAVAVCGCIPLYAQDELEIVSYNTFGGGNSLECFDHIQTSDGGYLLVGNGGFEGKWYDMFAVKTDENGDSLWTRNYGGAYPIGESCYKVIETENGYLLIGSQREFRGDQNALIIKINDNGDSLWSNIYGGEGGEIFNTALKLENGYIFAGMTTSWGNGGGDMWLLRTDENCESLWSRTYGGSGVEECNDMILDSYNRYILGGYFCDELNPRPSVLLVFTNEEGDSLNRYWHGVGESECCLSVNQLNLNIFTIAGRMYYANESTSQILTIAIDTEGHRVWGRLDGIREEYIANSCLSSVVTSNRNLMECVKIDDDSLGLIKLNTQGEIIFEQNFLLDGTISGNSILQNPYGSYSISGTVYNDIQGFFQLITSPDPDFENSVIHDRQLKYELLSLSSYGGRLVFQIPCTGITTARVYICDIMGRQVFREIFDTKPHQTNQILINISDYPSGMYLLRINTDNSTKTGEFVILK